MKFSCKTSDFLNGLQLVGRAIGTDQVLPILQNILIKAEGNSCILSATNLEISIVTSFEVSIENEGSITIPAKAILHFIQYNQDPEIIIESSEGTQLKLSSKRAKATIAGEAANGFPNIIGIEKETTISLSAHALLTGLNLVTFSCAKTTSRPVISGVFVRLEGDELILVGTDSYRLSEYKIKIKSVEGSVSCIIPARFLEELKGVIIAELSHLEGKNSSNDLFIEIMLGTQQIEVHLGSTKMFSRLIDGKFPDYLQVLPKEKKSLVVVNVKDLLSTIKRMHYFAKEQSNNITFTFSKADGIHITTKQTQLGRDESSITASLEGEDTKIALSSTYLMDFLPRISTEEVVIELLDKMHPAVFKLPTQHEYLHLIMPLRLQEE